MSKYTPDMYKAMHEMLKRLEWSYWVEIKNQGPPITGQYVCPECYQSMQAGHFPDCSLGNLLKELESAEGSVSDKPEVSK